MDNVSLMKIVEIVPRIVAVALARHAKTIPVWLSVYVVIRCVARQMVKIAVPVRPIVGVLWVQNVKMVCAWP